MRMTLAGLGCCLLVLTFITVGGASSVAAQTAAQCVNEIKTPWVVHSGLVEVDQAFQVSSHLVRVFKQPRLAVDVDSHIGPGRQRFFIYTPPWRDVMFRSFEHGQLEFAIN